MPNQLDLPDDLLPLIEKREQDDRRVAQKNAPDDPSSVAPIVEHRRQSGRRTEDQPAASQDD